MLNYLTYPTCLVPLLAGLATFQSCSAAPTEDILTAPDSIDAPQMLGPDNHPIPAHLADIYTNGASFHFSTNPQAEHLNKLNLAMLAVAKCTDGAWISSLVQSVVKNDDALLGTATVILAGKASEGSGLVWNKVDVHRAHLDHVFEIVNADVFDDTAVLSPWWPWAFTEAALKLAGDSEESKNAYFEMANLLQAVSGIEAVKISSNLGTNEDIWNNHLSLADSTPMIIRSHHEDEEGWYVASSIAGEGDDRIVKCDSFDSKGNQGGILGSELHYTNLASQVKSIIHLAKHAAFGGRPEHPAA